MNKLSDIDLRMIGRLEGKLGVRLDTKIINDEYYVTPEDLMNFISEIEDYTSNLEEKIEDMEQDIQENYKPKHTDPYDFYGVSRRDFV